MRRTKRIMSVPVGDALIGRVVNPLGLPIDGKGAIATTGFNRDRDGSPPASSTASR